MDEYLKTHSSAEEMYSRDQLSYSRMAAELDEEDQHPDIAKNRSKPTNLGFNEYFLKPVAQPVQNRSEEFTASKEMPNIKINYSYTSSKAVAPANYQPPVRQQPCVHSMPSRDALNKFKPKLSSIKQKEDEQGSSQKSTIAKHIQGRVFLQRVNQHSSLTQPTVTKPPPMTQTTQKTPSPSPLYQEEVAIRAVGDSIEVELGEDLEFQQMSERFTLPMLGSIEPQERKLPQQIAILSSLTTQSKNRNRKEKQVRKEKNVNQQANRQEDQVVTYHKEIMSKIESLEVLVREIQHRNETHSRDQGSELQNRREQAEHSRREQVEDNRRQQEQKKREQRENRKEPVEQKRKEPVEQKRKEAGEQKRKEPIEQNNKDSAKYTAYFPTIKYELEEDIALIKSRLAFLEQQQKDSTSKQQIPVTPSFRDGESTKPEQLRFTQLSQRDFLASIQQSPSKRSIHKSSNNQSRNNHSRNNHSRNKSSRNEQSRNKQSRQVTQIQTYLQQLGVNQLRKVITHKVWEKLSALGKLEGKQKQRLMKKVFSVLKIRGQFQISEQEEDEIVASYLSNHKLIAIFTTSFFYFGQFIILDEEYRKESYGLLVKPTCELYKGSFKNNYRHGKGLLLSLNKDLYEGEFAYNLKQGKGTSHYANGDLYKGTFDNNEFHGRGEYCWRNGASYEGEFSRGKMHGKGHWRSEKGDEYVGGYRENLKEGWGVYSYPDGRTVEGYFCKGRKTKNRDTGSKLATSRLAKNTNSQILRHASSTRRLVFDRSEHMSRKRENRDFSESLEKFRIRFN